MSLAVSIDNYADDQLGPLFELFGSYFQPDDRLLTAAYTRWLYAENPFGLARMVKVTEGERWVGFMAMIPVELARRGERLRAYYVVNVLVHPEFLGKHLFGRMITAAKKLVTDENAVLMGHPNELALKSWQRARMHFHDVLKPVLAVPRLLSRGLRACNVNDIKQLQTALPLLAAEAAKAQRWSLAVTSDYVSWRFLCHPTNTYRVQLLEGNGVPAGFLVTRKVRPGINLLVDQFTLGRYATDALACLPWVTVSFRPMSSMREFSGSLWPLPVKKQVPFFCTYYQQPFIAGDVMNLGLSASDF
ncbi:MAG: GNAT family N-acetyltransferase [Limnohabitans sp.]